MQVQRSSPIDLAGDDAGVDLAVAHDAEAATVGDDEPQAKKRRSRQNFSWRQISVLEQVFETDPLPRQALVAELAQRLSISPRCVQVWFQNRRQKWKNMHQAIGQEPPVLKNSSSRLTSLEKLLPDLAPLENPNGGAIEGTVTGVTTRPTASVRARAAPVRAQPPSACSPLSSTPLVYTLSVLAHEHAHPNRSPRVCVPTSKTSQLTPCVPPLTCPPLPCSPAGAARAILQRLRAGLQLLRLKRRCGRACRRAAGRGSRCGSGAMRRRVSRRSTVCSLQWVDRPAAACLPSRHAGRAASLHAGTARGSGGCRRPPCSGRRPICTAGGRRDHEGLAEWLRGPLHAALLRPLRLERDACEPSLRGRCGRGRAVAIGVRVGLPAERRPAYVAATRGGRCSHPPHGGSAHRGCCRRAVT